MANWLPIFFKETGPLNQGGKASVKGQIVDILGSVGQTVLSQPVDDSLQGMPACVLHFCSYWCVCSLSSLLDCKPWRQGLSSSTLNGQLVHQTHSKEFTYIIFPREWCNWWLLILREIRYLLTGCLHVSECPCGTKYPGKGLVHTCLPSGQYPAI